MKTEASILIVDDTESNIDTLMILLEDKYDIVATLEGESVMEIIEEEDHIDLILLDIMMPGIDGFEVCKRLKANPRSADIPIIFITSKTDDDSIERAYEAGGVDYITKPFRAREVLSRVSIHLALKHKSDTLKVSLDNKTELINELLSVSISLTSENRYSILLEKILQASKKFSNADAGVLYLVDKSEKHLEFKIVQADLLDIKMGGTGDDLTWEPLELYLDGGKANNTLMATQCCLESKLFNVADIYHNHDFDFVGTRAFDMSMGYKTKSMLVVPIFNRHKEVIGVLELLNKKDDSEDIVAFTKSDEIIISSMASLGAVSIHNHQLVDNLEDLFESFIKTIADTMEDKSKYTKNHISRVATIVDMISSGINSDTVQFGDISFSKNELKELHMAALLHDIGKVVTPEAVMDKATRLETIVDRISIVIIKFDILRRDFYIEFIKNSYDNPKEIELITQQYRKNIDKIDKDEEFLVKCNTAPFLSKDDIQRVTSIAQQEIIINSKKQDFLTHDELHNLTIEKGTLTQDERDIINNHVIISYKILKNLPFPKKYKDIPKIAGSHHKSVDGASGYAADELMGIPLTLKESILAVADVFEALTSPERPYKKPYTLNESFKIMSFMVKDGHLNKEIVDFILSNNLHVEYANRYLDKAQIDKVKTSDF